MISHQKVRAILKKNKFRVVHYIPASICSRFVGGDIIVNQPCKGSVHVSLYRKKDVELLRNIKNCLRDNLDCSIALYDNYLIVTENN